MPRIGQPTGHSDFRLIKEIIALSEGDCWEAVKDEWELAHVCFAARDEPGVCICGHRPIIEQCVILNLLNGNLAMVGNVCVGKFTGLKTAKLFEALKRVIADPAKALTLEMLEHAWKKGWITSWQQGFYLSTLPCRRLSPKQVTIRKRINDKILRCVQPTTGGDREGSF